jgi:two-component system sporulation sensor kinase C
MGTQAIDSQRDTVAGDFIPLLAHEVRNPLTNINLSVEIMDSFLGDSELKVYTEVIRRNVVRINQLVIDLLNRQKFAEAMPVQMSVQQLLDEVISIAKDRFLLKHVEIVKEYGEDCLAIWNRPNMIIAFTNIIVNAIDAMDVDKGQLCVTANFVDNRYVIKIADNGCGISKRNLRNIFKAYFTSKEGGLGLGLSITLSILQQNHINVAVESKMGQGTSFILSL